MAQEALQLATIRYACIQYFLRKQHDMRVGKWSHFSSFFGPSVIKSVIKNAKTSVSI